MIKERNDFYEDEVVIYLEWLEEDDNDQSYEAARQENIDNEM